MESLEIIHPLKERDNFIILGHVRPDGDAIGASLALYEALKKMNKNAMVLMKEVDQKYSFLLNFNMIQESAEEIDSYKTVIVVDCGDRGRLGDYEKLFNDAEETICIDHHVSHEDFAKYNYKNQFASSTSEMIYQVIRALGVELDEKIANNLYLGIAYDTGGFRHSNVSPTTLQVAADLVNAGAKVDQIMHQLFYKKTLAATRLMSAALQTLELHGCNRIASLYLSKEILRQINPAPGEADGIVNIAKDIENVEVAIFLIQDDDDIKVSLRSAGKIDVSEFASRFGGGGHIKASGFRVNGDLQQVKELLIKELIKLV